MIKIINGKDESKKLKSKSPMEKKTKVHQKSAIFKMKIQIKIKIINGLDEKDEVPSKSPILKIKRQSTIKITNGEAEKERKCNQNHQ
jgi:hypothetical protein